MEQEDKLVDRDFSPEDFLFGRVQLHFWGSDLGQRKECFEAVESSVSAVPSVVSLPFLGIRTTVDTEKPPRGRKERKVSGRGQFRT